MRTYQPRGGEGIDQTAKRTVAIAKRTKSAVVAYFNGVKIMVNPDDQAEDIVRFYWQELRRFEELNKKAVSQDRLLVKILGVAQFLQAVGISQRKLQLFKTNPYQIPSAASARMHFLWRLIACLRGSYNKKGVRRWFGRQRQQLNGRSARDILSKPWRPADPGPQKIYELARALRREEKQ